MMKVDLKISRSHSHLPLARTSHRHCRHDRSSNSITTRALAVPDQFGYVGASVTATAVMMQYLAVQVAIARRKYNVPYPSVYAEGTSSDANTFNCIQRSHLNTLEYVPQVLALQIVMGLKFPAVAASLGLAWCLGRIVYAAGYSTGEPQARAPGSAIAGVVYLALIGGTGYSAFCMIFP